MTASRLPRSLALGAAFLLWGLPASSQQYRTGQGRQAGGNGQTGNLAIPDLGGQMAVDPGSLGALGALTPLPSGLAAGLPGQAVVPDAAVAQVQAAPGRTMAVESAITGAALASPLFSPAPVPRRDDAGTSRGRTQDSSDPAAEEEGVVGPESRPELRGAQERVSGARSSLSPVTGQDTRGDVGSGRVVFDQDQARTGEASPVSASATSERRASGLRRPGLLTRAAAAVGGVLALPALAPGAEPGAAAPAAPSTSLLAAVSLYPPWMVAIAAGAFALMIGYALRRNLKLSPNRAFAGGAIAFVTAWSALTPSWWQDFAPLGQAIQTGLGNAAASAGANWHYIPILAAAALLYPVYRLLQRFVSAARAKMAAGALMLAGAAASVLTHPFIAERLQAAAPAIGENWRFAPLALGAALLVPAYRLLRRRLSRLKTLASVGGLALVMAALALAAAPAAAPVLAAVLSFASSAAYPLGAAGVAASGVFTYRRLRGRNVSRWKAGAAALVSTAAIAAGALWLTGFAAAGQAAQTTFQAVSGTLVSGASWTGAGVAAGGAAAGYPLLRKLTGMGRGKSLLAALVVATTLFSGSAVMKNSNVGFFGYHPFGAPTSGAPAVADDAPTPAPMGSALDAALAKATDPAIKTLITALKDPSGAARQKALEGLFQQGTKDPAATVAAAAAILANDPLPGARAQAALILARLGEFEGRSAIALPPLAAAASAEKDDATRQAVTRSVGIVGLDPKISPADKTTVRDTLAKRLAEDSSPLIRREAARSLGELGDAGAAAPLREAMTKDADPNVKAQAAISLLMLGQSVEARPMVDALALQLGSSSDASERVYAASHLGGLVRNSKDEGSVLKGTAALAKAAAEDPSASVRTIALGALEQLTPEKLLEVLPVLERAAASETDPGLKERLTQLVAALKRR